MCILNTVYEINSLLLVNFGRPRNMSNKLTSEEYTKIEHIIIQQTHYLPKQHVI